jgi:hypothetical protein
MTIVKELAFGGGSYIAALLSDKLREVSGVK